MSARFALASTLVALAVIAGGCGRARSGDASPPPDAVPGEQRYAEALKDPSALGRAKAYRIQVLAQAAGTEATVDEVAVLRDAALELPATAYVAGIRDDDGDGLDDDRKVEVTVESSEAAACMTLPESGTGITVAEGLC